MISVKDMRGALVNEMTKILEKHHNSSRSKCARLKTWLV
jgi:hypothetical protein